MYINFSKKYLYYLINLFTLLYEIALYDFLLFSITLFSISFNVIFLKSLIVISVSDPKK